MDGLVELMINGSKKTSALLSSMSAMRLLTKMMPFLVAILSRRKPSR